MSEEKVSKNHMHTSEMTYMKINTYFMKFMTVYPIDDDATIFTKAIFIFWRYFNLFCLVAYPIQAIMDLASREEISLVELAPNLLHIVLYVAGSIRTAYFYYKEEEIRYLVEKMNRMFKWETDVDIDRDSMAKTNKVAKILTGYWQFNLFFTAQFLSLIPMAFFSKTGYILPFPAWYPWNWQDYFKLSYGIEILYNFFLGFSYSNPDSFYVASVLLLAKQWDILGTNLRNYLYSALLDYGVPLEKVVQFSKCYNNYGRKDNTNNLELTVEEKEEKDEFEKEMIELVRSKEFYKHLHKSLVSTIEEHKRLIEYSNELQDFMSPFVFIILFFGTSYVIFIIFCVTTTTNRSTILGLAQYFFTGSTQNLLFTFFGHMVLTNSGNVQQALYESPWYICPENFKSTFKFVFLRTKNPQMLSGANFFIMRLDIFVTIQRTVFSFYTLLRQMNAKNNIAK